MDYENCATHQIVIIISSEMTKIIDDILRESEHSRMSVCLRKALRLAERTAAKDLSLWCRLELGGYYASNPAMNDDIIVPEYRTVVGQHFDVYGNMLIVPADLSFINEMRMPNGVEELETLVESGDLITVHNPNTCELIKEHLKVQVYAFRFSRVHLIGVLSQIRTQLSDRLEVVRNSGVLAQVSREIKQEEILELRPNLYGIGIDLRALWRRLRG